jgi:hypothetical protein
MNRRFFLAFLAASAAGPALAQSTTKIAGAESVQSTGKPYDLLPTPVAGDAKRVRAFFAYDCLYSQRYLPGLLAWGSSLPRGVTFDSVPVIPDADNPKVALAVVGRLIAQAMNPKVVAAYDYSVFTAILGDEVLNTPPAQRLTLNDVLDFLVKAGIPRAELNHFLRTRGKGIEKNLPAHAQLIKTYHLSATPSISIGGRVVVNPDHTQGNPDHMLLVMNGLVSRLVQGNLNGI